MSDASALPPLPGGCPNHPQVPAYVACRRCGTLVCATCVAGSPPTEPVCPACIARHGYEALRREGAEIDPAACFSRVWKLFQEHWTVVVVASLLVLGLQVAASIPGVILDLASRELKLEGGPQVAAAIFRFACQILSSYVGIALQAGIVIVWLRLLRGQPAEATHVFHGFRYGHRILIAMLAYFLAVVLGLLGLVVGAFVVAVGLSFYVPLMVDKGMAPLESLRTSWELTRGQRLPLFAVFLLGLPVMLVGLLACCIGVIPASGIAVGMQVAAYDGLVWPGSDYARD